MTMTGCVVFFLALASCVLGASQNSTTATNVAALIAPIAARQQMSETFATLALELQSAWSFNSFATAAYAATVLQAQPNAGAGVEAALDKLEDSMEVSLLGALKVMQIQNVQKLDKVGRSHNENLLNVVLLQQMSSNPIAAQMLYLVQYKDTLDALSSSASFVRQDAWSFWNYNEIIASRVDGVDSDAFDDVVLASKAVAMNAYLIEAQIDVLNLYIEASLEAMTQQLLPNTAPPSNTGISSSFGTSTTGSSVPTSFSTPTASNFSLLNSLPHSFLEETVEMEPAQPTAQSSLPAPDILGYLKALRSFNRVLNFAAATALLNEVKLEEALTVGVLPEGSIKSAESALNSASVTAATAFRSWAVIKYVLAATDAGLFTASVGANSFGSLNTGTSSFSSSFGADSAPLATAAAVAGAGSLAASAGNVFGNNFIQENAIPIHEVAGDSDGNLLG